jgi:polysaccharide biosynthesis transport protein
MGIDNAVSVAGLDTALSSATRVARERWWIILVATAIGLLVGIFYGATTTKTYTATAKVLIQPTSPVSSAILQATTSAEDPTRIAATDLLLLTSPAVADAARRSLGTSMSTSDLLSHVTATEEPNSDLFDVAASDGDPAQAARIANAFATQFVAFRRQSSQQSALAAQSDLQARIAALPPTDTADAAALRGAVQRVAELAAVSTGDALVVGTASPPSSPSSPRPKLDAAVGLILGLAFGLILAFAVDLADRRVKNAEGFEAAYGLDTLVHVPSRSLASGVQPGVAAFEPYRILAGTLTFSHLGRGIRSLLVTSAVVGEGKTTVAVGLAQALADGGHDVTLVELDQRRPSLARHFSITDDGGLTAALLDDEPITSFLQRPVKGLPTLRVLAAGPRLTSDPVELLHSAEMDRVMQQLLEVSEFVIYDAPPMLGIADAQAVLDRPRIDASIIVARANRTSREEIKRARAILNQHHARPLGLVLTGLEEPGATTVSQYYSTGRRFNGAHRAGDPRVAQRSEVAPARSSGDDA